MAKKKSAKRSSGRRAPARRASAPAAKRKETVRVKTFIVEKPVYIEHRPQGEAPRRPFASSEADEYPAPIFDSEKSPYLKRRAQKALAKKEEEIHEELLGGGGEYEGQGLPEEEKDVDEVAAGEELSAEEEASLEEGTGEGEKEEALGEDYGGGEDVGAGAQGAKSHYRSRGLFTNVWWKKAIIWAVFIWVIILGIELGMQAMKLIEVDLTRQWWVLLGIIIVISMIYQKFFAGKIRI